MTRLILAAAGLSLLALAACGDDNTIPIDRPIMQGEPAPPAVPTEPIQRRPLSAPPSSLTEQQDPAQTQTTTPAK